MSHPGQKIQAESQKGLCLSVDTDEEKTIIIIPRKSVLGRSRAFGEILMDRSIAKREIQPGGSNKGSLEAASKAAALGSMHEQHTKMQVNNRNSWMHQI